MCRVSQILADSLSDIELSLLRKISQKSTFADGSNLETVGMLRSLRLIEFASAASLPQISRLGITVLVDRIENSLNSA